MIRLLEGNWRQQLGIISTLRYEALADDVNDFFLERETSVITRLEVITIVAVNSGAQTGSLGIPGLLERIPRGPRQNED